MEELLRYDPRNRLTAYTKGNVTTPFQYDNAGNLLADDKALYSYDAFNRTVRAETFDGHIQLNRYDAEGLRYEMEENGRLVRFIFNQDREAVTEENAGGLNRLIRGTELIASRSSADSARTYYHYASDEMGSATHIVNETGAVQNRYEYDAWGNITAKEEQVPNRFTYYGQQIDPITQQYYLRARFYNPVVGRFTQEDTYRGDGLNLYTYCRNNSVFYTNPYGNACEHKDPLDPKQRAIYDIGRAKGKTAAQAYVLATGKTDAVKPPMSWNEFQHADRGKWTKGGMSEAYARYKETQVGINSDQHYLHRPYLRQSTRTVIDSSKLTDNRGYVYDPTVDLHMPGPYDIGHIPGREFRTLQAEAEQKGMSQAKFNDWVNAHPEWFFIQNRDLNRSHLAEAEAISTSSGQDRLLQRALEILSGQ